MSETNLLFAFEEKYPFLYRLMVNGVPLYTCLRDHTLLLLRDGQTNGKEAENQAKGRVFPKRLMDGFLKLPRLRRAETVIFTSSVYRRDHGRNLAAEYLMERYPNAVVFEWPSRNEAFDSAYFSDPQRERYCPLDFYLVRYKLAVRLNRKRLDAEAAELRAELQKQFDACPPPESEGEAAAIRYLLDTLPESCVTTRLSQEIFRKMFRKYASIRYAVDFWGSGRENIFPVLRGNPEKIELQHGLINGSHPGYIYPDFVRELETDFFKRTLLVYGEATKRLLFEQSVFRPEQIKVIGNPRIHMYRKVFGIEQKERKLILFTSQPFEQDGNATAYYRTVIPFLQAISEHISKCGKLLRLAVKLHPREGNEVLDVYRKALPDCILMDRASDLYGTLARSWLHVTANSTVLYEALAFGVPTLTIPLPGYDPEELFWPGVIVLRKPEDAGNAIMELCDTVAYGRYLDTLRAKAEE